MFSFNAFRAGVINFPALLYGLISISYGYSILPPSRSTVLRRNHTRLTLAPPTIRRDRLRLIAYSFALTRVLTEPLQPELELQA
jgi:hypothetical protein